MKKPIYTLTIISTCTCGQDIHSYVFNTKKDAQKAMKEQYKADKQEIDKSVRIATIDKDGYEVYEDGRFCENHLVATITKITEIH